MTQTAGEKLAQSLPFFPKDQAGPVFAEPWQAQAFALVLSLYEAGAFTWDEWASTLSREITAAQNAGDPDLGDTYYNHWLAALERLAAEKQIVTYGEQAARKDLWRAAYLATPHGAPVELENAERD